MRKSRFTEQQIVGILRESEAGVKTADLSGKHGISINTLHRWRSKYGGIQSSEVCKLKALKDENAARTDCVRRFFRSRHRDRALATDAFAPSCLPMAIGSITSASNDSTVRSDYNCRGFILRWPAVPRPDYRRRLLAIFTWHRNSDVIAGSSRAARSQRAHRSLRKARGNHGRSRPRVYQSSDEPMARERGIQLDFIDPGRSMQNDYVESFNDKFRDKCLSQTWFTDVTDAARTIESWLADYNTRRPHLALGNLPPQAFLDRYHEGELGHIV
jgi:putative transposase